MCILIIFITCSKEAQENSKEWSSATTTRGITAFFTIAFLRVRLNEYDLGK